MKKLALVGILAVALCGCAKSEQKEAKVDSPALKDGTYHGESSPDDWGGRVIVDVEIKDGKYQAVNLKNVDNKGQEKGEDYGKDENGKITNPGLYKIAQQAVESTKKYPEELIETQDPKLVEVISGATMSHKGFVEAVEKAVEGAK